MSSTSNALQTVSPTRCEKISQQQHFGSSNSISIPFHSPSRQSLGKWNRHCLLLLACCHCHLHLIRQIICCCRCCTRARSRARAFNFETAERNCWLLSFFCEMATSKWNQMKKHLPLISLSFSFSFWLNSVKLLPGKKQGVIPVRSRTTWLAQPLLVLPDAKVRQIGVDVVRGMQVL